MGGFCDFFEKMNFMSVRQRCSKAELQSAELIYQNIFEQLKPISKYIMAEAFRTNIVLHNKEAKTFIETMVVTTPKEMLITPDEVKEMRDIAKKLDLGSF